MAVPVDAEETLAAKFAALFPHLDERQRRLVMGAEARVLGHGGIKVVAAAADVSAVTVASHGASDSDSLNRACGAPGAWKQARRVREAVRGNGPVDDTGTAPRADFTDPPLPPPETSVLFISGR